MVKIPEEMIEKAQKTSILDFCAANQIALIKTGNSECMLADNHSLKINIRDNLYNDFGQPEGTRFKGGNVINFARATCNYSFAEAVENILEVPEAGTFAFEKNPYFSEEKEAYKYPRWMIRSDGEWQEARKYLIEQRALDDTIVDRMYEDGLIEQTKNQEVFFHWIEPFDPWREKLGATIQGTKPLKEPVDPDRPFRKMIVKSSTSGYGFNFTVGEPQKLVFCESPIDTLSYYENKCMKNEADQTHYQSIEGLKGNVIEKTVEAYLKKFHHPPKEVILAFDNDTAGKRAFLKYKELPILKEHKILVRSGIPKKSSRDKKMDWNQKIQNIKRANTSEVKIQPTKTKGMNR